MYKRILIPIDLATSSEINLKIINAAMPMINTDTAVTLLHVHSPLPNFAALQIPESAYNKMIESSKAALQKLADNAGSDAELKLVSGNPDRGILDYANDDGTDLIVMAASKLNVESYLLGSTTARVTRRAGCNVLIVR